jgi:capsular polysaccharide biosynthesis protein
MQDQAPITPAYDLGHYLRPLQRQRKWLALAVVGGLVLGLAYSVIAKPTYTAAARVQIGPPLTAGQAAAVNGTGSRTASEPVNPDTEAQNVKSLPVAILAQQILKSSAKPGALLARITVTVPANTTILRIACVARSAGVAQACANAFASGYLKNRAAGETTGINNQIASLDSQIATAQALVTKYTNAGVAAAKGSPRKVEEFALEANQAAIVQADDVTEAQLKQLLPADAGSITSLAGRGISSRANLGIPPITGLILGLIIGLALVYGRERFDRNVRHRDDLTSAGVELIAEIELARGGPATRTRFDQRIASIVAGSFDEDGGVVYVANVSPQQADADVAGKLASTLASVGHHVELVRPFGVQAVETVAFESTDHPAIETELVPDGTATLLGWPAAEHDAATAGELVVAQPDEVVLTPVETSADTVPMAIRIQLELARNRAHFVVVDGDPAVSDAQAYVLAGLSDATLLVVDPDKTTRHDLAEVVDQLSVTGTELLGAVIWRPLRTKPGTKPNGNPTATDADNGSSRLRKRITPAALTHPADRGHAHRVTAAISNPNGSGSSLPPRPVDAAR